MTTQNYAWSAANNAFYPFAFEADYRTAGTWPEDAIGVDDSVYLTYAVGTIPEGQVRGVDATTKMPTWIEAASLLTLAQAQENQIAQLSAACQAEIVSGFSSSALGTAHTYPSKQTDQLNLAASVTTALIALNSAAWASSTSYSVGQTVTFEGQAYVCTTAGKSGSSAPTWPTDNTSTVKDGSVVWQVWTTLFWATDAGEFLAHNAAQIQQVGLDGKTAIANCLYQNNTLGNEVMAAKTVSDVQAVIWVSPTA